MMNDAYSPAAFTRDRSRILIAAVVMLATAIAIIVAQGSPSAAAPSLMLTPTPTPTATPVSGYVPVNCTPSLAAGPATPRVGDGVTFTLSVDCSCPPSHTGSCSWSNYSFDSVMSDEFDFSGITNFGSSNVWTFSGTATEAGWATVRGQWYGETYNGTNYSWRYMRPELQMQVRPAIDTSGLQAEFDAALAFWEAEGIETYSVSLEPICFCINRPTIRTWVDRFGVANQISSESAPIWDSLADQAPIQLMFDLISDTLASGDFDQLIVDYDETYGFPTRVSIDRSVLIADEEITYLLSDFVPNDSLADALYDVANADLLGPGSEYSMTTTRQCFRVDALPECSGTFTSTVDIRDGDVVASDPEASIYPIHSIRSLTAEWRAALDWAARKQLEGWNVTAQAIYDGELFFLRSFELSASDPLLRIAASSYSGRIDSFGLFGCCEPGGGEPVVVWSESFEGASGQAWTFGPDSAIRGNFSIGRVQPTKFRSVWLQPGGASSGDQALVTNGLAGYRAGSNDVDGGETISRSPIIDLPADAGSLSLSFDWFFAHASHWDASDGLQISIEAVGPQQPSLSRELVSVDGYGNRNGTWESTTADISAFAGQPVQITVVAADRGVGGLVEAGVDNLVITASGTSTDPGPAPLWSEGFEDGADGWQFRYDGARTGLWGAADPEGTQYRGSALQQENASEGINALVTDGRRGSSVGSFDIDGGSVVALSPPIAIPVNILPTTTTLNFDWYFTHLARTNDADFLKVDVVGVTSRVIAEALLVEGVPEYRPNTWESTSFDISSFQGQEVRIVVTAADGSFGSLVEAGIDNLSITMENLPFPVAE